jgi:DnaK suppressor protein
MAKSKGQKKDESLENGQSDPVELEPQEEESLSTEEGDEKLPPFLRKQKSKLLQLRDSLLDSMTGVSRDTLRSRAEGSEASAFGMHQADAGSDAYDRDFALSLLSQEQDALYEIEEALKRVEAGTYGICEMSGKPIPHARLEAIPFARFTVECQTQIEKQKKALRVRQPVTSLFGLTDEEGGEGEEEDTITDSKD